MVKNVNKNKLNQKYAIQVSKSNFTTNVSTQVETRNVSLHTIQLSSDTPKKPDLLTIKWQIPAHNIKGMWKPSAGFSKRIEADWELDDHIESTISIDAPVISLFGHDNTNIHTFACSEAIDKLRLNARIREEDNRFYCYVNLFLEDQPKITSYSLQIRIDEGQKHFSEALKEVSEWWESFDALEPTFVPDIALTPLYSTWYNFHQSLKEENLIAECKKAYQLGYRSIVIDDGWQTNDGNRGYDYTGDWEPERLKNPKQFVDDIHKTCMKIGFWYSVPFCGKKSKAFKRFRTKLLSENHRWAPVLDPRYAEVRNYLIDIYRNAVLEWNLDGLKLDFIDEFRLYHDTPEVNSQMDYSSINLAVDRLMTDVITSLKSINPDIFIEFRQKYVGPAMRKYGNMFRAFDCPGDATMNRVRIADIRMLSGNTAVHSDMITWHHQEQLEIASLQMVNTLFGVPQISVVLDEIPEEHLAMVAFYTQYWNTNKTLITQGNYIPYKPLANYPIQKVSNANKALYGLHDDFVLSIDDNHKFIDILNAKLTEEVIIKSKVNLGLYQCEIYSCKGDLITSKNIHLNKGILEIQIPHCGIAQLTKQ